MPNESTTKPPNSHGGPGRAVSLRPSDWVSAAVYYGAPDDEPDDASEAVRDPLASLRTFKMSGDRDHKIGPTLNRTVRQAIQVFVRSERNTFARVFAWLATRGMGRIETLPATRTIGHVFGVLVDTGANVDVLDSWSFALDRAGNHRESMHSVPPSLCGHCQALASTLGLSASTIYALAVLAGLGGLTLRGELAEAVQDTITDFRSALEKRARHANRVLSRQKPGPTLIVWEP